jgi:hypothetical protein
LAFPPVSLDSVTEELWTFERVMLPSFFSFLCF